MLAVTVTDLVPVGKVIVGYRACRLHAAEDAVVIGDDQAVSGHEGAGAAAQLYDSLDQACAFGIVDPGRIELQPLCLEVEF